MKLPRGDAEHALAVFIDFENLAMGFQGRRDRFEIQKVLERLVEKGKIVVKRAYADWSRFSNYTGPLHDAAIELIEIPKRSQTGKNSADIRLVVDAIDLAYSKDHIDTFAILSGDSDFSPLVSKLKELGKHVLGMGLANATSNLLRDNCDEFIYYEDLERAPAAPMLGSQIPEPKKKLFNLLMDSLLALRRENKDVLYSSMVKDTMKRKKPSFNEEYHGYRTFSELLEDAQKHGLLDLEKSKSSGTYVVTRFGTEPKVVRSDSERSDPERETSTVKPGRGRRRSNNGTGQRKPEPPAEQPTLTMPEVPSYRPHRQIETVKGEPKATSPLKPGPPLPANPAAHPAAQPDPGPPGDGFGAGIDLE